MIHVVDLSLLPAHLLPFSPQTLDAIGSTIAAGGNVLVYHNRRGSASALVCSDCGTTLRCPRCDATLTLHEKPIWRLLCHHCGYTQVDTPSCRACGGVWFERVGIGTQAIETRLAREFPHANIIRLDRDVEEIWGIYPLHSTVFVGTRRLRNAPIGNIDLVVFPVFESELSFAEYDTEERVYLDVRLLSERIARVIIQTRFPRHPVILDLLQGSYRDFFRRTLAVRRAFGYPPYGGYIQIFTTAKSETKVRKTMHRLSSILMTRKHTSTILHHDPDDIRRRAGEFLGSILLKGEHAEEDLHAVESEIWSTAGIRITRW